MSKSIKSIFETPEFEPYAEMWNTRIKELDRRSKYYDGTIYSKLRGNLGSAEWLWPKMYQGVKPLYLPLSRAVNVDAGIIPGDWALPDGSTEQPFNPRWQPVIDTVFSWSHWFRGGVLYVHYGAQHGVSGLKICTLPEQREVWLKAIKPTEFICIPRPVSYDRTPWFSIEVKQLVDENGKEFEYAEVVNSETIRTYKDGEPFEFDGREAEYPNNLGAVPILEAQHIDIGEQLGESTYQNVIPMLDEVNTLASYLADIIGKNAEPQWVVFGVEATNLKKSGDKVWVVPNKDGRVEALLPNVDIEGVLEFVREIRDQVHGGLPELSFEELRKKDQIATATLELQMMELVIKIKRCRPNYDQVLADALRVIGRADLGIPELAVLNDEDLAFDNQRPILPLDPETSMRLEQMALALERERALTDSGEGIDA